MGSNSSLISVIGHLDLSGDGSRGYSEIDTRSTLFCAGGHGDRQDVRDKKPRMALGPIDVRHYDLSGSEYVFP